MAYDVQSTEIAALDDFPGAKIDATVSSGKARKFKFSGVVLTAATKTGELTTKMPAGAKIERVVVFDDSGTGTVNIGLSGGTATAVGTGYAPAVATTDAPVDSVDAGGQVLYATAVGGAISFHGWVEYSVSA